MNKHQRDSLSDCLSRVFGRVDDEFIEAAIPRLAWIELAGGETLFHEGDAESGAYFVISGRLRASVQEEGRPRVIGEIARGETVGEMAVLSGEPRSATVTAIRDTVLAHITSESFEALMHDHPQLAIQMARMTISRLRRDTRRVEARRPATMCMLAVTDGVDLEAIGQRLADQLGRWGRTARESSSTIDARFGRGAAEAGPGQSEFQHRVAMWFEELEFGNDIVLLVADPGDSEWTRRCIRHADELLLLARADAPVATNPFEREYLTGARARNGARQTLILLHDRETAQPSGTVEWLDRRPVDAHLHVRPDVPGDIARLARIFSGNTIGLVLGGGGARGFAHLGVYRALQEAGIAIDYVGGTSIGGVMALYISFGIPAQTVIDKARRAFARNPTGRINPLPLISLMGGRRLKATIDGALLDAVGPHADLADCWLTPYCVATNFSRSREVVIRRGPVSRALRASVSIPVALPPVPWEGDLLVDGGLVNNFPTDVMVQMGAQKIIGVDLARDRTPRYEHDEVPGWWTLMRDRFRPRDRRHHQLPGLGMMLMGSTLLHSESRRKQARSAVDLYFNPDLRRIGLLDWKAFDRIVEIGYLHAREVLSRMSTEELAPYSDVP